ncbi:MAG: tetratricopeptide repeat protein, partial [Anaerolineales bacterium]|nr:tetratricopeptide repeat protein [Anaerolineales bacterium]
RAVTYDAANGELFARIGELFMLTAQPGPAHEAYSQLLELEPNSAIALAGLGRAKAALGQSDEAIAMLERA